MIPIYDFDKLTPEQMLNRDIRAEENVEAAVKAILAEVRQGGDQALLSCEKRFDGVDLDALEVTEQELEEAANALETLGAGEPEVLSLSLPGGEERKLILCQKLRFTPKGYPRHGGTILKHPL